MQFEESAISGGLPSDPAPLPQATTASVGRSPQKFWGILTRRERWGLSLRGWSVLVLLVSLIGYALLWAAHPFLAVTHRRDASVLVVEGWIHEYAIRSAVEEFKTGRYKRILTTGGPVSGLGRYVNDYQTSASVGAGLLRKAGVPDEFVQMVPSHVISRDRTYSSAVALRVWFRERNQPVRGLNVLTEDAHARRTRLLFEKAFGDTAAIGIVAVPNPDYDPKHWWRYSEGVREVLGESIAYLYARLFFHPSDPDSKVQPAPSQPKP
jgi:uncharacterized SAM-binding protein YcdF (DUF218 family)